MSKGGFSAARPSAFTLIELLIVIGIIVMLLSILLPAIGNARNHAKAVVCQTHERALWQGVLAFASDNEGHVVGNQKDDGDLIPSHRDFLRGGTNDWKQSPQAGTLFRYVNRNLDVYLCPTRDRSAQIGTANAFDLSSNGHFDYTIMLVFAGAKLEHLPAQAKVTYSDGTTTMIPTPYIVEEQPNAVNNSNMEGGHSETDHLAHNHFGGSYYVAPDGSCQFFIEPSNVDATGYSAITPTGKWQTFKNGGAAWGYWDKQ